MGKQILAVSGLLLAGFGMLFIDPILLSDVGFQLSFAGQAAFCILGLYLAIKRDYIGSFGYNYGSNCDFANPSGKFWSIFNLLGIG